MAFYITFTNKSSSSSQKLKIMALLFQAAIYQTNSNATGGVTGQYMAFPSNNVIVKPVIPAFTASGVTVNSQIQLIPGGTVVNPTSYYSDRSVAQIVTLANA